MNQVQVNETAYHGAGWAWALRIGGGEVVHARFVEIADDDRAPTVEEVKASLDAFMADVVVVAAEAAAQAAWDALEAAEAKPFTERTDEEDKEIERLQAAFDACACRVQLGMMSGGAFCVDFTKAEHARAGLDKTIYV